MEPEFIIGKTQMFYKGDAEGVFYNCSAEGQYSTYTTYKNWNEFLQNKEFSTFKELKELAKVLLNHPHVFIGTDDIYEKINLNDEPFYNIVMVEPKLKDRTIILSGVSKAYAMTGWRIGYAAGPAVIIKAMGILQSQSTSNPTSISQVAADLKLSSSVPLSTNRSLNTKVASAPSAVANDKIS